MHSNAPFCGCNEVNIVKYEYNDNSSINVRTYLIVRITLAQKYKIILSSLNLQCSMTLNI